MKVHVVLPKFYQTRYTDNYKFLFKKCAWDYGFKVEYSDNPKIVMDTDVVILFATPQHNRNGYLRRLADLPSKIKVVGFMRDIHDGQGFEDTYPEYRTAMYDRYDLIISPYKQYAETMCESIAPYLHKHKTMWDWVPKSYYENLGINKEPIQKVFVSGNMDSKIYPFRNAYIKSMIMSDAWGLMEILPPPWPGVFDHDIFGVKYAEKLHQYRCCFTSTGIHRCVVAKFFEIPASGSLLIAPRFEDVEAAGFIDGVHYLGGVTMRELLLHTKQVLVDNKDTRKIQETAQRFVLDNHTEYNRAKELYALLEEIV